MANIANLAIKLFADSTAFTAGLDAAAKKAEQFGAAAAKFITSPFTTVGKAGSVLTSGIDSFLKPIQSVLSGIPIIGGALGALPASASAFSAWINQAADDMLKIDKQARALGVSTEFLSSQLAAAGPRGDEFAEGLQHLARNFGELQAGSKDAEKKFNDFFGVVDSAKAARGKGFEEFIGDVADQLHKMPTATERAAAGFELFGRGGQVLIDKLSKGSGALKDIQEKMTFKGVAFSSADVADLQKAKEAVKDIELSFVGVGRQLAIAISPLVKDVAEGISGWLKGVDIKEVIGGMVESVLGAVDSLAEGFVDFVNQMKQVSADIRATLNPFADTSFTLMQKPGSLAESFRASRGDRELGGGGSFGEDSQEATAAFLKLSSASKQLEKDLSEQIQTIGMSADEMKIWKLSQEGATATMLHQAEVLAQQKRSIEEVFGSARQTTNIFDKFRQQQQDLTGLAGQGVNTIGAFRKLNDEFENIKKTTAAGIFERTLSDFDKLQAQIDQTTRLMTEGLLSPEVAGRDLFKLITDAESKLPKVALGPALDKGSSAEISFRQQFEASGLGKNDPQERVANLLEQLKELAKSQNDVGRQMLDAIQSLEIVGVQ